MASWDTPAVAAPSTASYAAPLVQFPNLAEDFFKAKEMGLKTREMQRAEDQATAFRAGIPKTGAGDPDYSAMTERMLQLGQYPQAVTFQNTGIELARQKLGQAQADRYLSPDGSTSPPTPPGAPPAGSLSARPQASAPTQPTTVMSVLAAQGVPNDQLQAASDHVARQLGVSPTDPIDTRDPRVTNVLGPAIGELKRAGIGKVVSARPPTEDGAAPSSPDASPNSRVSGGFQGLGPATTTDTPSTTEMAPAAKAAVQSRLDAMPVGARKALLENWASNPAFPKSLQEFAEKRLAAVEKGEEPTTEIKNQQFDSAHGGVLTRHEAGLAGAKEEATAPYKIAQAAVREGGRPVAVKPNEVVTTGSQLDPALSGFTDWAAKRIGAPTAGPSGAPAAPSAPPMVPSPPLAPTTPGAPATSPAPGRSGYTPQLVRNPDGSVASTVTPSTEALQKTAAQNYEKARETYAGSQEVQSQLLGMEDAARTLNKAGWSTTGTGGNARLALAKTVNSVWSTLGVKDQNLPFDPNSVASWEKLTKETTRLGFGLARTLGAREAMQVVQGAIRANPNIENTPLGFRMVLNSIRQNAERQSEYFEYATKYAQEHGGDLVGAEVAFNKQNPPALYARRAIVQAQKDIPQEAIEALRGNPSTAKAFDEHYRSPGLAKLFLGNAGGQ